jgi:L-aspartate oxidase
MTTKGYAMGAVARNTFDRLVGILPDAEIVVLAPVIDEIEQLKRERNAMLLAHNYPDAELAPRDILAREIWAQHARGRGVYLDATEAIGPEFPRRFPNVWREAVQSGLDPRSAALPVTPAEHYFMGGIASDSSGRTSLPGLWAVGEVAGTGLHGANRLASNSLLEAMVLGAAAS